MMEEYHEGKIKIFEYMEKELIKKLEEYIEFLNSENKGAIQIAILHHFKYSNEVIEKGIELREEIKLLKEKIENGRKNDI